jgi:hypothetical protein
MPRLFALDKNFPQPIVGVLSDFQTDATLVPLDQINPRMSTLDDWELLLALHHHADPWDGLITTDTSMLAQGPELATLIQTRLTLVVAVASGHNQSRHRDASRRDDEPKMLQVAACASSGELIVRCEHGAQRVQDVLPRLLSRAALAEDSAWPSGQG